MGTNFGWRPSFGILVAVSAIVFLLSFRLKPDKGRPEVQIDFVGVILAAAAMILISFGFNNLNRWGLVFARPGAPFDLLGVSPAPVMILVGIVLGQTFVMWTRRRQEAGKTPLLALEVIGSSQERAAVYAMFSVVALEAMLNFSVPLYIQIVQGRSPLETAIAMMPFNLTVFFTAMLIVKLYTRLTPQQIGRYGFILCTVGAAVACLRGAQRLEHVSRPHRTDRVRHRAGIAGHAGVQRAGHGLAQGARRRRRLAARHDAKPRRRGRNGGGGCVAGRSAQRDRHAQPGRDSIAAVRDPAEVDLDSINFVNNDQLKSVLERTSATPAQVAEAVRINSDSRLRALKIGLLIMAGRCDADDHPGRPVAELSSGRGAGRSGAGKERAVQPQERRSADRLPERA